MKISSNYCNILAVLFATTSTILPDAAGFAVTPSVTSPSSSSLSVAAAVAPPTSAASSLSSPKDISEFAQDGGAEELYNANVQSTYGYVTFKINERRRDACNHRLVLRFVVNIVIFFFFSCLSNYIILCI